MAQERTNERTNESTIIPAKTTSSPGESHIRIACIALSTDAPKALLLEPNLESGGRAEPTYLATRNQFSGNIIRASFVGERAIVLMPKHDPRGPAYYATSTSLASDAESFPPDSERELARSTRASSAKTILSPNAAAISSSVFCFVSLPSPACQLITGDEGEGDSREVEVCHDKEERSAANEDVVVVLLDGGESRRPRFRDCESSVGAS